MATTKTAIDTPAAAPENTPGNGAETAADVPETATGTDTRPAPNRIGGTVWSALIDHPGTSAATLATAAGVGKATARRALNDLEKAGYAARTPGGRANGKRAADTWRAVHADTTTETETTDAAPDATAAGTPGSAPATDETPATVTPARPADAAPDTTGATTPGEDTDTTDTSDEAAAPGDDGDEATMDEAALAEARTAVSALATRIETASAALTAEDRAAALEAADAIFSDSAKVRRLIKTATTPRRSRSGKPHAHPGELRAKVAAHLTSHPGLQLTPHEVGKAIGHSAGAVANALDKLTETGQAVLTCERPRRFTATDEASDTTPHTATTAATA